MHDVEYVRLRVGATGQGEDPLGRICFAGLVCVNEADGREAGCRRVEVVLFVHLNRRIGATHAVDLDRIDLDPAVIAQGGGDHEFGERVLHEDGQLRIDLAGDGAQCLDVELSLKDLAVVCGPDRLGGQRVQRVVAVRGEDHLAGLAPRDFDQVFDHPPRGDGVQAVLDLLDQDHRPVGRLFDGRNDADHAGLASPEMELGVLGAVGIARGEQGGLALGVDRKPVAALHLLAEDFLDGVDDRGGERDLALGDELVADRLDQFPALRGGNGARHAEEQDVPRDRLTVPLQQREARRPLQREARAELLVDHLILDDPVLHAGVIAPALGEEGTGRDALIDHARRAEDGALPAAVGSDQGSDGKVKTDHPGAEPPDSPERYPAQVRTVVPGAYLFFQVPDVAVPDLASVTAHCDASAPAYARCLRQAREATAVSRASGPDYPIGARRRACCAPYG